MFTLSSRRLPSASAHRQILAVVTAAFIILQSVLFATPQAVAQRGVRRDPVVKPKISVTTLGSPITQSFDTLPASGSATWTNDSTLPGWYHARTGTGTTIVANDGSSNAGNLYSYGTGTATDRALGSIGSGNAAVGNLFWGIRLTNNTGSTITQLDVSYTGEQWRNSAAAAQTVSFSYLVGSPTVSGSLAEFQSAGVAVPQLDFTSPITGGTAGALNGNLAANRITRTHSITGLNIPNGTDIMLRWSDPDHTGADHGLSVDDFSVTPQGTVVADTAPSVSSTVPADNATGIAVSSNVSITFSEAVNVGSTWFQIVCATSGTRNVSDTAVSTSDNITFTINPTNDFATGEVCTVTVDDAQVTDQDATDPPDTMTADYVFDFTTAGAPPTPIHTIQGSGASSPLAGQSVTTTGIVTLLRTGSNAGAGTANGYFLQTPDADADADPNTSQGIFVFTSSVPTVAVGDEITVTGTVVEFNGLTEIGTITNTTVIDTGNTLPTAVTLDATILSPTAPFDQSHLEKYEAMRMSAAAMRSTSPNDNFFDIEAVLPAVPREQVFREPGIPASDPIPPDPTSGTPDPNIAIWDENPEQLKLDTNGRAGAPNTPYTSNVTFSNVAGPLDYAFGQYRLVLEAGFTTSANMIASPAPTPNANEFTVVGYNIENFNNATTQREKAALTIRTILHYPDIIGTVEIFDLADLQALRDEINNDAVANGDPNPQYEAYLVEQDGTSEDSDQDVGYLVKTSRVSVTSVTQEREEETFVEPGGGTAILHDRPPLVLDATVDPSGANPQRVLVVVNHLRSFIDIELVAGDGPRVREKRKKQAESLADLLNDLQTANPTTPVISVGDYNAFQFSSGYDDSISVLKGNPTPDDQIVVDQSPDLVNPDFFNLIELVPAAERYTFFFDDDGAMQVLDHVLVNTAARQRNTRIAIAHVNVDFPGAPTSAFASDASRVEHNSDHDPVISYFALGEPQPTGSVIISEFRFRGPGASVVNSSNGDGDSISALGAPTASNAPGTSSDNDEFVEIYNNTDADITVSTIDGSAGWALVASDGVVRFTIPNGTIIPARGHFLGTNSDGYSLADYGCTGCAAGDITYTTNIPDGGGIALFRTSNPSNFNTTERLDAAGYAAVDALYREGAGFPAGGAETTGDLEYSFVRYMGINAAGRPRDTGNNLADFIAVNTSGAVTALGAKLGAPGPENLFSPIQSNATVPASSLDGTVSATSPPNRVRDLNDTGANKSFGTLSIRRTLTNNTGRVLPYLILRIVDLTTFAPPNSATADLRALDSATVTVTVNDNARCASDPTATSTTAPCDVTVQGLFVEQPPTQPNGGGWNTSLLLFFEVGDELAAGATVNVNITFGVEQKGAFRFFYNIEAPPDSGIVAPVGTQMPGTSGRPTRRAPR